MKILVFNAGSSSLKFGVFDMGDQDTYLLKGQFEGFKDGSCALHYTLNGNNEDKTSSTETFSNPEQAIAGLPDILKKLGHDTFDAIGHRVVHGGERFNDATLINDEVLKHIENCNSLAPLHNPANLKGITVSWEIWPETPQVAIFDTAFHHTIPENAYTYAVPEEWRKTGLRRYGFHGTSHKYIGLRIAEALKTSITDLKIISCHLGNGASVCAINRGFSIDTSMGMTPLEGLVMGTRSGDVDPGTFGYLKEKLDLSIEDIEASLYKESGLKGLSGTHDLRDIERMASEGDKNAQLAINVFAYRVRKYIGSYAASMGGVDVIAFTGGIGENSASMRRRICDKFEFLGLHLDDDKNNAVNLSGFAAEQIESPLSRIKVIVTPSHEQTMIARQVKDLLKAEKHQVKSQNWHIPVAVSARHVHLSEEAVEALFGKGYQLKKMKQLSQPAAWAAEETVAVIGPKGSFEEVRVLGPTRKQTQIEVSKTDTFKLGVEAPVRPSGQLENTPSIKLRGPAGEITTNGLIIAARHVHMSVEDAKKMGLENGDYVEVRLDNKERGVSFSNTLIRVKDSYVTEMHIDTDEANAAGISMKTDGELILDKIRHEADITSKNIMSMH